MIGKSHKQEQVRSEPLFYWQGVCGIPQLKKYYKQLRSNKLLSPLLGLCVGYSKEEVEKAAILDPGIQSHRSLHVDTLCSSPNTHSRVVSKTPSTFT